MPDPSSEKSLISIDADPPRTAPPEETAAYEALMEAPDIPGCEGFLRAYPQSPYALAVRPLLNRLYRESVEREAARLWEVLEPNGEARTIAEFIERYPGTKAADQARRALEQKREKDLKTWRQLRTLEGHSREVEAVAFSPDGSLVASGSRDETIRLWRVKDGTPVRTLEGHSGRVQSVAFSPDGSLLASGSGDETIRLWRVKDGTLVRTLEGHSSYVYSVAFSPDGSLVASGSWDKTIRLWRVKDGTLVRTLKGHSLPVMSIAFSPDGSLLASGSGDKTIRLWGAP